MENTKNKLSSYEIIFLNKLKQYINSPLYFYGSIQRNDYIKGTSDIDVSIFTDNESSTMFKLNTFLNLENNKHKTKLKKIILKSKLNNELIYGYKLLYIDTLNKLRIEFLIYNIKYKTEILNDHKVKIDIPYYISALLMIIKVLYYYLNIITKEQLKYFKRILLSTMINHPVDDMILL